MKNVAIFVYDITLTGGAEHVALNLAEKFSEKYNVHLISLFSEKEIQIEKRDYKIISLNSKVGSISKNLIRFSSGLRKYLKENDIDVLLCITAGIVTIAALACCGIKTKNIYCEHSNLENKTYGKKHELRQFIGAKFAEMVVTLTQRDRNSFLSAYKLNPQKVVAIPNWIENCQQSTETYDVSSKKIITAGRLERVKGYDNLLRVAEKVFSQNSDWHWDIYGDGSLRGEIQKEINELNIQDFVSLKGNVSDLSLRYKSYSLFVLTSYYEGLPLVLLEAQNANLPIVSFDCPTGPSEIVENGVNGLIVEAYDTNKMADAINLLISNANLREEFSKNTTNHMNRFNKETVFNQWCNLIDRICDK